VIAKKISILLANNSVRTNGSASSKRPEVSAKVIQLNGSSKEKNLMLRSKAYEAYEAWWEYWLSKIPQNPLPFERSTKKPLKPNVESSADRAGVLQRLRLNPFHNVSNDVPRTAAESWED
jgi:hypothetical protein